MSSARLVTCRLAPRTSGEDTTDGIGHEARQPPPDTPELRQGWIGLALPASEGVPLRLGVAYESRRTIPDGSYARSNAAFHGLAGAMPPGPAGTWSRVPVGEVLRSHGERYGAEFSRVLDGCRVWVNGEGREDQDPVAKTTR